MPAPNKPPGQRKPGKVRLRPKQKQREGRAIGKADQRQYVAARDVGFGPGPRPAAGGAPAGPARPSGPQAPAPTPKYGPSMQRAQADAQLVYGDPILRAQATQQNAGTYFDQYKADVAAAQAQVKARYDAAQATITGPTVGPAVQTAEGDQAAKSREIMQQAAKNLLTTQGTAQQDYFTGRQTVGSAAQLQARTQAGAEVNRLGMEKAAYTVSQRGKYRDEVHQQRLENKAFGLDVVKAQNDAAADAAKLRQDKRADRQKRRDERNKVNAQGYTNAEWSAMTPEQRRAANKKWQESGRAPKTPADEKNPFSAKDQAKARTSLRKALAVVKRNDNGVSGYGKDIYQALVDADVDPVIARAAVQLYKGGKVGPNTANALKRDYGIRVAKRGKAKRPAPYSPPADSPGSDAAQG